ncbi:MAG: hypothetical protein VX740_00980 [Pseudomonadota bacterium]|jgi:hypothetical protein|nr:hypothetical protein [Alphaproteobacteria bacterium]MEC7701609.1 hypothetical protein [Pseudomonadota bacterium]MED5421990.1 hypothetical protein [Pseudomonadota bacterium]MEE3322735.1 hypothetical protein [Pseudomonadota bacterium]
MDILITVVKILLIALTLPFRIVYWVVLKLRGGADEIYENAPDESYDFDAVQDDDLDYDVSGYGDDEISNERNWKPLKTKGDLALEEDNAVDGRLILDHHALFVRHEGRQVLVVDYVLPDVPQWLEYQRQISHFSIVMTNGDVAHIDLKVDERYLEDLEEESRILLVTSGDGEKIVHHLMFLLK